MMIKLIRVSLWLFLCVQLTGDITLLKRWPDLIFYCNESHSKNPIL